MHSLSWALLFFIKRKSEEHTILIVIECCGITNFAKFSIQPQIQWEAKYRGIVHTTCICISDINTKFRLFSSSLSLSLEFTKIIISVSNENFCIFHRSKYRFGMLRLEIQRKNNYCYFGVVLLRPNQVTRFKRKAKFILFSQ